MTASLFIGVLSVRLLIPGARTKKDKRQVLRSLRGRIGSRFDVLFRESAESYKPSRCEISIVAVSNERASVAKTLDKLRNFIDGYGLALPEHVALDVFPWSSDLTGAAMFEFGDG